MMAKKWEKKMYQWNFKIKLQFTNFPLFISDYRSGCWLSVQKQQLDPLISIYNTLFNINININIYFRRDESERPWICLESRPAPAAATWNLLGHQHLLRHSVLCRRGLADYNSCWNQVGEAVFPPLQPPSRCSPHRSDLGKWTWRAGEPPPPAGSGGAAGAAGLMGGLESVNRLLTDNQNPEVGQQESGLCVTSSRFWVSSQALEGQKWFDQISSQW